MDSLTQIVLGGAVGELTLGKKVGNKAILWGAIAGTIPDLDMLFVNLFSGIDQITVHRGFSHSLLFPFIMAPLLGWLIGKIHKQATFKQWTWLFFWSIITHPLLDIFTLMGTQFFWPFEVRVSLDSIFIIDPIYTLPFLVCLVWLMFYKRDKPIRRKLNYIGIGFSSLYLVYTLGMKTLMSHNFEAALENKEIEYRRTMTTPMPLTSFYWSNVAEGKDGYYVSYYSLFDNNLPTKFDFIPRNKELLTQDFDQPPVRKLLRMLNGYYSLEKKDDVLIIHDLRFSMPGGFPPLMKQESVFSYHVTKEKEGFNFKLKATEGTMDFNNMDIYLKRIFGVQSI